VNGGARSPAVGIRRWAFDIALLLLFTTIAAGQTGAVNGFVRDRANGEPLAYANVYLEKTDYGAATNTQGYYYIGRVAPGEYELVASYIGYGSGRRRIRVEPGQTVTVGLELSAGAVELGEVKVSAERARFEREVEVSATRLETRQLALAPRTGGELDLFRTIQLLPGVVTTSDFSNRLYIRGGSPDQNLVLLDGITVYSPSHLFGLFSPFIPEALSEVTLLAGGFPARFGGRLSSVLDIVTKEGNARRFTGDGSISLIAAKAQVEGPIPSGSFLVAGRRTYLPDFLLRAFGVRGLGYHFYDLLGKANYQLNPDFRFTLSGLGAEDVLAISDPDDPDLLSGRLAWGNRGLSLRSSTILNPTLYGNAVVAWSNLYSVFDVTLDGTEEVRLANNLGDVVLKADYTWYAHDRHTLEAGCEGQYLAITSDARYVRNSGRDTLFNLSQASSVWPLALYASDKWEAVKERLFVQPGLRYAFYSAGTKSELEPRIGLKYRPAENTALSVSTGRFTQPLVTLNSTEAIFSIFDAWQVVPSGRPAPSALHAIAGVEQWLSRDAVFEFETYYKRYDNLLETRYGRFFTPAESLLPARGYSVGYDMMLRRTEGRVNGWVSYSFVWTRRSIGEETYHPHYDRRHNVNVVVGLPALFWGADLSLKFNLGTGLPYAGIIGYYHRYAPDPNDPNWYRNPEWGFIEGPRDAFRYPLYHRLDLGLVRKWETGWGEVSAFFDLANAYNAKNVLLYFWDVDEGKVPVRREVGMIPILPTLGVKVRF